MEDHALEKLFNGKKVKVKDLETDREFEGVVTFTEIMSSDDDFEPDSLVLKVEEKNGNITEIPVKWETILEIKD